MTRSRLFFLIGTALILIGLGLNLWSHLFAPNEIDSAELVPGNTIAFASIPNGVTVLDGYQTSQLKTLIDSPNAQPLHDAVVNLIGKKNVDLLDAFLPSLSGQSFIAVTHFDYDHPEQVGLIAAMKPKAGLGDFDAFLEKLKTTWPDMIKQGKTGTGNVAGVDYDWIQGPGAPDKICVARVRGWIVTSWGEASLQDWLERFQKKSTTSSLAEDVDYRKALEEVGDNPMTLVYVNYHSLLKILQQQMEKTNPAAGDFLAQKLDALSGAALATRFENGEIADRFSFLIPRPAQLDSGMGSDPCPFETLKFTGPDTRFYMGSSINWKQYFKNLKDQSEESPLGLVNTPATVNPMASGLVTFLQNWMQAADLDPHDIINALGPEFSVQAEWPADSQYPEVGLFVKLDKPDDFKPAITAIIESVRKAYKNSAVITELNSNGQHFATLQFVQSSPFSPTITEDGPYLGVFLTENQAVRSFQRDPTVGLAHNADFNRQVGDKRNGAAQVFFLDSPYLLNRAYQTAMPYLSLAGMFNKDLAAMLKGKDLPADLTWLAPMGTWSCIITPDEEGVQGYSVSGIGNQGIFLAGAMGGTANVMQSMGLLPKMNVAGQTTLPPGNPAPPVQPNSADGMKAAPPLPVPANTSAPETTNQPSASVIYISSESEIFFDNTPVTLDQIDDFLKSKKAENQNLKLTVKIDKDASPDVLSRVMDAGASAGFGVLPYAYASGPDSLPPAISSNPNGATNAAPAGSNSVSTPSIPGAASNSIPITNSDATPQIPAPLQAQ